MLQLPSGPAGCGWYFTSMPSVLLYVGIVQSPSMASAMLPPWNIAACPSERAVASGGM
jgi:hypothetical protein